MNNFEFDRIVRVILCSSFTCVYIRRKTILENMSIHSNVIEKVKSLWWRLNVGFVQVFNNDILLYYTQAISYFTVTATRTEPNIWYNIIVSARQTHRQLTQFFIVTIIFSRWQRHYIISTKTFVQKLTVLRSYSV